jgi:hypothetical protein
MHRLPALALILLWCGCTPTTYAFTPSTRGEVPRPAGCEFKILDAVPADVSYEEIGKLEHYNGDVPKSVEGLRKAIKDRVCSVGGDAVVAEPGPKGEYRSAQVIKFTGPGAQP